MDTYKIARYANLMLAGVLTGNEFGGWAAVHPALGTLPLASHVAAEQAVTQRYKAMMPLLMTAATISSFPVLGRIRDRRSPAFELQLTGAGCYGVMLAVTLLGNMPINNRVLAASPDSPPADWLALRRRWDRLHTVRNLLNMAGLSCFVLSALDDASRGGASAPHRPK